MIHTGWAEAPQRIQAKSASKPTADPIASTVASQGLRPTGNWTAGAWLREARTLTSARPCQAIRPSVAQRCRSLKRGAQRTKAGFQTRRNTRVPLVPPKPKLFLTATSNFRSRAMLAQ